MYKICEFGYMLIAHVLYCTRHHSQINTYQPFPSPPPPISKVVCHHRGGGGGDERTTRPAEWLFINCSGRQQEQKEQIWIKGLEWNCEAALFRISKSLVHDVPLFA